MWDYFHAKKALELGHPFDMVHSPFAFPLLPPRANPPLGISNTGKIKDTIVHDRDLMMNKLYNHHEMFQHHASGLFNMAPNQFAPGHPLYKKMRTLDALREENEKLRQENSLLKTGKNKEKKN
ncbi:MAG: hypothetical protein KGI27_04010 [Thaumarchaeota archaeon]|nr:hypothetical protein [Nitrososphaerota archaeon]